MTTKTKRRKSLRCKKLSTLLAIGLRDLRKQERARRSIVEMNCWLDRHSGACSACLAGSVMRFSLPRRGIDNFTHPSEFDDATECRLYALDALRCGEVSGAAANLMVNTKVANRRVVQYDGPDGKWWAAMRKLLKDLREAGE